MNENAFKKALRCFIEKLAGIFDERYGEQDKHIGDAIKAFPQHKNCTHVLAKVAIINSLYNTRLSDREIIWMTKNIKDNAQQIGDQINNGGLNVTNTIIGNPPAGIRRQYSFATKYAAFHAPERFPIYDKLVKDLLHSLNNKIAAGFGREDGFFRKFTKSEIEKPVYELFVEIINGLIKYIKLDENRYKYKRLDQALWLLAKYIDKNYHHPLAIGPDMKEIINDIDKIMQNSEIREFLISIRLKRTG